MLLLRRSFLEGCLSLFGATTVGTLACSSGAEDADAAAGAGGEGGDAGGSAEPRAFGPLLPDADGILELPEGFSYVVVERALEEMSDGHPMGKRPDGMACFVDDDGNYVLLRNHELDGGASAEPTVAYNPNMLGGVSRVVVDAKTLERVSSNWVLCGTHRNCAGGPSPWGWLSCEESEEIGHGYVFVCAPTAASAQAPQRARSLGRFKHEAVAVDPATEIIYLTEDQNQSALYRHVPSDGPFVGQLQALKVVDRASLDLSVGHAVGDGFDVEWVDIADAEAEAESTAAQAFAQGAAVIARGEGIWFHDGSVFFVSTSGGPLARGQVFRLDPSRDGGKLTLLAQANDANDLVNPDNITVSPRGQIFVVEDNDGPNHIWRIGDDGQPEEFAKNVSAGGVGELCGVCFSPDGKVMFVNMQEEGFTLAIRGPF